MTLHRTLSCTKCKEEEQYGRKPKCVTRGPQSCPLSDGSKPDLTPELLEVVNVYNLLAQPLVQACPGLQTDILDIFRSKKTLDGHRYFYRMLCHLHTVYDEFTPKTPSLPDPAGFPRDSLGAVRSKAWQESRP